MCALQTRGGFVMFDVNEVSQNNRAPLTYLGSIASGALTFPQLVEQYEWKKLYIEDTIGLEGTWLSNVYYAPVEFKAEVIVNV